MWFFTKFSWNDKYSILKIEFRISFKIEFSLKIVSYDRTNNPNKIGTFVACIFYVAVNNFDNTHWNLYDISKRQYSSYIIFVFEKRLYWVVHACFCIKGNIFYANEMFLNGNDFFRLSKRSQYGGFPLKNVYGMTPKLISQLEISLFMSDTLPWRGMLPCMWPSLTIRAYFYDPKSPHHLFYWGRSLLNMGQLPVLDSVYVLRGFRKCDYSIMLL